MLMVCPNCHSDQIITVQDQRFCINCGQMVSEDAVGKAKPTVAVQANGLPEGVKILPVTPPSKDKTSNSEAEITPPAPDPVAPAAPEASSQPSLVHARSRLAQATTESTPGPQPKRRKPGRPKAGRLDVPRAIAASTPAALPAAPKITRPAAPAPTAAPAGPRRMSDLAPRRQPAAHAAPAKPPAAAHSKPHRHKPRPHRVGVPPLHYAPVLAFSLRARARPRLVALAALGALSLGAASAYGTWLLLSRGVTDLADGLMQAGPRLAIEALLLGIIYYLGRSIGQTAITYGIARESDQRPVTLSRQLGVAINTFGRRLLLDLGFGVVELAVIAVAVVLFVTGGTTWPMHSSLQHALVFCSYLALLYLLSALAVSRGIAGINLTLTKHRASTAAKLGWELFSHRIELIGPRFGALLLETLLAVPLVALAVAFVVTAPPGLHLAVAAGAGLLAWLAGAMLGVGTAAWWTMLYRQLVLTDRPGAVVALLSSRQPEDARRAPLALIVALGTLTVTATLALPWLNLG